MVNEQSNKVSDYMKNRNSKNYSAVKKIYQNIQKL